MTQLIESDTEPHGGATLLHMFSLAHPATAAELRHSMPILPMADEGMALHPEILSIGSFAVEADAFHSTRILLSEVDLINPFKSEEIQNAATKVKDAIAVELPHEIQDHATALVTSMTIAGKGGQTGGQIHIAVIWQSRGGATDLDL